MAKRAPGGYDEIGEGLAQAVAEGHKTLAWAVELSALAGYGRSYAPRWVAYYRETHADELAALERRRQRKTGKVELLRKKSQALRQKLLEG